MSDHLSVLIEAVAHEGRQGCRVARMLELVSQETAVPNGDLWKSLLWPLVVTRTELQYYLLPLGSEPQPMTAPPGPVRALSAADDNLATWATAQEKGVVVVATESVRCLSYGITDHLLSRAQLSAVMLDCLERVAACRGQGCLQVDLCREFRIQPRNFHYIARNLEQRGLLVRVMGVIRQAGKAPSSNVLFLPKYGRGLGKGMQRLEIGPEDAGPRGEEEGPGRFVDLGAHYHRCVTLLTHATNRTMLERELRMAVGLWGEGREGLRRWHRVKKALVSAEYAEFFTAHLEEGLHENATTLGLRGNRSTGGLVQFVRLKREWDEVRLPTLPGRSRADQDEAALRRRAAEELLRGEDAAPGAFSLPSELPEPSEVYNALERGFTMRLVQHIARAGAEGVLSSELTALAHSNPHDMHKIYISLKNYGIELESVNQGKAVLLRLTAPPWVRLRMGVAVAPGDLAEADLGDAEEELAGAGAGAEALAASMRGEDGAGAPPPTSAMGLLEKLILEGRRRCPEAEDPDVARALRTAAGAAEPVARLGEVDQALLGGQAAPIAPLRMTAEEVIRFLGVTEVDLIRYPAISRSRLVRIVKHVRHMGFIWQAVLARLLEQEEGLGTRIDQKMLVRYFGDLEAWGLIRTHVINLTASAVGKSRNARVLVRPDLHPLTPALEARVGEVVHAWDYTFRSENLRAVGLAPQGRALQPVARTPAAAAPTVGAGEVGLAKDLPPELLDATPFAQVEGAKQQQSLDQTHRQVNLTANGFLVGKMRRAKALHAFLLELAGKAGAGAGGGDAPAAPPGAKASLAPVDLARALERMPFDLWARVGGVEAAGEDVARALQEKTHLIDLPASVRKILEIRPLQRLRRVLEVLMALGLIRTHDKGMHAVKTPLFKETLKVIELVPDATIDEPLRTPPEAPRDQGAAEGQGGGGAGAVPTEAAAPPLQEQAEFEPDDLEDVAQQPDVTLKVVGGHPVASRRFSFASPEGAASYWTTLELVSCFKRDLIEKNPALQKETAPFSATGEMFERLAWAHSGHATVTEARLKGLRQRIEHLAAGARLTERRVAAEAQAMEVEPMYALRHYVAIRQRLRAEAEGGARKRFKGGRIGGLRDGPAKEAPATRRVLKRPAAAPAEAEPSEDDAEHEEEEEEEEEEHEEEAAGGAESEDNALTDDDQMARRRKAFDKLKPRTMSLERVHAICHEGILPGFEAPLRSRHHISEAEDLVLLLATVLNVVSESPAYLDATTRFKLLRKPNLGFSAKRTRARLTRFLEGPHTSGAMVNVYRAAIRLWAASHADPAERAEAEATAAAFLENKGWTAPRALVEPLSVEARKERNRKIADHKKENEAKGLTAEDRKRERDAAKKLKDREQPPLVQLNPIFCTQDDLESLLREEMEKLGLDKRTDLTDPAIEPVVSEVATCLRDLLARAKARDSKAALLPRKARKVDRALAEEDAAKPPGSPEPEPEDAPAPVIKARRAQRRRLTFPHDSLRKGVKFNVQQQESESEDAEEDDEGAAGSGAAAGPGPSSAAQGRPASKRFSRVRALVMALGVAWERVLQERARLHLHAAGHEVVTLGAQLAAEALRGLLLALMPREAEEDWGTSEAVADIRARFTAEELVMGFALLAEQDLIAGTLKAVPAKAAPPREGQTEAEEKSKEAAAAPPSTPPPPSHAHYTLRSNVGLLAVRTDLPRELLGVPPLPPSGGGGKDRDKNKDKDMDKDTDKDSADAESQLIFAAVAEACSRGNFAVRSELDIPAFLDVPPQERDKQNELAAGRWRWEGEGRTADGASTSAPPLPGTRAAGTRKRPAEEGEGEGGVRPEKRPTPEVLSSAQYGVDLPMCPAALRGSFADPVALLRAVLALLQERGRKGLSASFLAAWLAERPAEGPHPWLEFESLALSALEWLAREGRAVLVDGLTERTAVSPEHAKVLLPGPGLLPWAGSSSPAGREVASALAAKLMDMVAGAPGAAEDLVLQELSLVAPVAMGRAVVDALAERGYLDVRELAGAGPASCRVPGVLKRRRLGGRDGEGTGPRSAGGAARRFLFPRQFGPSFARELSSIADACLRRMH